MTAATDGVDDWWFTREPRSSLRSTGDDSNASTQRHDRYMLRDGSVATAFHLEHITHTSVYRQHTDADEDRGSQSVVEVRKCTARTESGQVLIHAAPHKT